MRIFVWLNEDSNAEASLASNYIPKVLLLFDNLVMWVTNCCLGQHRVSSLPFIIIYYEVQKGTLGIRHSGSPEYPRNIGGGRVEKWWAYPISIKTIV